MIIRSNLTALLFILCALACFFAQSAPQHRTQSSASPPDKVALAEVSTVRVPSLPAESIVNPALCEPDGAILLRLAMPDTGVEDPVLVSSDGKTVIRFGREKINDVPQPTPLSIFMGGSDVYILTRGSVPSGDETKWRTPSGEVQTQQATKNSTFVAHFERNGTYEGAVRLDLPFKPLHLGVFDNGDFLIAGIDPSTSEPRVAIVASNGQIRRLVELKGDVHAQNESDVSGKDKDPSALPRFAPGEEWKSLTTVVYTSQVIRDGPNLLLFRQLSGPVFSVSPAGEVRIHKLKVEGDYRLFAIKAARSSWIVEFIRDLPHSAGEEFATYAFDPESGAPLREYFFPKNFGWGLACTDGDEFTFVMANDATKTLEFIKLAPAANTN
jgi:hypothetical protein